MPCGFQRQCLRRTPASSLLVDKVKKAHILRFSLVIEWRAFSSWRLKISAKKYVSVETAPYKKSERHSSMVVVLVTKAMIPGYLS